MKQKQDRIAKSQRFLVASYVQDETIDNTSSATILAPVKTVSEQASMTLQAPSAFGAAQTFNVVQIMTDTVASTYLAESSMDRLSALTSNPVSNEGVVVSHLAGQLERKLKVVSHWMERCALYQAYAEPTTSAVEGKTRGLIPLMSQPAAAGNNVAVVASLTSTILIIYSYYTSANMIIKSNS